MRSEKFQIITSRRKTHFLFVYAHYTYASKIRFDKIVTFRYVINETTYFNLELFLNKHKQFKLKQLQ